MTVHASCDDVGELVGLGDVVVGGEERRDAGPLAGVRDVRTSRAT